jgi:hypothetical protein
MPEVNIGGLTIGGTRELGGSDFLRNLLQRRTAKDELGRGGPLGLRDIVSKYFLPRLKGQQEAEGKIQGAVLDQLLTPGKNFGEAQRAAEGYANELFAPGGQVASLISRARGGSVSRGFDPTADVGGGERGILGQASSSVGNFFAQQAGALEGQRIGALTSTYQSQEQLINDLLESVYSGVAGSEQLQLAKHPPRQKFLGIF